MKHLARLLALAEQSREPTLASVPGILVRTIMRTLARVVLLLAGVMFLVTVALLNVSLILATFSSSRGSRFR